MTSFDDRKNAFEDKFAHEEAIKFKSSVKAAKFFGLWVAEQLGIDQEAYALELVNLAASGKSEDALIDKISKDSTDLGKAFSLVVLQEKYSQCFADAKAAVLAR
jgi:hypothetical protein